MIKPRFNERRGRIFRIRNLIFVILALLAIYPHFADEFYTYILIKALILGISAMSLDLSWGFCGILCLGQAAFLGLGAYAYTLAVKNFAFPGAPFLGIALAIVLPAILAGCIAYPSFRRGAHVAYFAIITLAISLILAQIAVIWYNLTGGSDGITDIPFLYIGIDFGNPTIFYYFTVLICGGCYLIGNRIIRSPFGRVIEAIRENEERAEFLSYNVTRFKVVTFMISAAFSGLAGSLYAPLNGIVYPDLFGLLLSTQILIWATIGGRGTLLGGFLGAILVNPVESIVGNVSFRFYLLVMGALFIFIVLFFPRGIMGLMPKRNQN